MQEEGVDIPAHARQRRRFQGDVLACASSVWGEGRYREVNLWGHEKAMKPKCKKRDRAEETIQELERRVAKRTVVKTSTIKNAGMGLFMEEGADKGHVVGIYSGEALNMQGHPDHVLLKLDFTNAFNTVWRSAILKACQENEKWRHLYRFFWATLSPIALIMGIRVR